MRKISYTLEIGFAGCSEDGELDISDEMSPAEIDEMVHEMAIEYANGWEGDTRLYSEWDEDTIESYYENTYGFWEFIEND